MKLINFIAITNIYMKYLLISCIQEFLTGTFARNAVSMTVFYLIYFNSREVLNKL